ncbi:MAG: helix-turn-helix transcriptional regulator [Leptolyngbya sp. SIO4C1]|nr:helix-turn-helix transcriptional regulator [Leptolyngbya sp. SIO4C1]
MMATVLQQILNCAYYGLVKRAYLESKVVELMALLLEQETVIRQGGQKKISLKSEQIERIHYAREILLRDLSNPPSLLELAHQVGLNEFMLKQGFRQMFDNTVFGELRSHRLEIAQQLLAEQETSVAEVAHLVGYACVRSFAKTFKRKFGLGPKAYQKACR